MKKSSLFVAVVVVLALLTGGFSAPTHAQAAGAYIRFIQMSPDLPLVQGTFNGSFVTSVLSYGNVSPYIKIDAGTFKTSFKTPGTEIDPSKGVDVEIADGNYYSLIAVGQVADNSLKPLIVNEAELLKSVTMTEGASPFLFVPSFSSPDPVDVYINDAPQLTNTSFLSMGIIVVPNGIFTVKVTKAGAADTVLASNVAVSMVGVSGVLGFAGTEADKLAVKDGYSTIATAQEFFQNQTNVTEAKLRFNSFLSELTAAGLTESLSATDPFTLLVASDLGYSNVYGEDAAAMEAKFKEDAAATAKAAGYAFLDGRKTQSDLVDTAMGSTPTITTRSGDLGIAFIPDSGLTVNGDSAFQIFDIQTVNATIHIISAPITAAK